MLHIVLSHFVGRLSLAGRAAQGIYFTNIAPLKFIQSNPLTVKSRHRIDLQIKINIYDYYVYDYSVVT